GAAGLSTEELETLRFAATLHDIGKIGVGDEAIGRVGQLDVSDEIVVRMHPLIGISILQPVEFLAPALPAVRYHHERWDGNGYPDRLQGEAIPLAGRIMALADVFDALTSKRVYKESLAVDEAMGIIAAEQGQHFDPSLVEVFLGLHSEFADIAHRFADPH
ncbi:MAG TPA: HD domain-containing phosphohydrolase, partial [Azonexus sp.]|nr:HD domain-containing phosphohydrolase [Azonexus sp.]